MPAAPAVMERIFTASGFRFPAAGFRLRGSGCHERTSTIRRGSWGGRLERTGAEQKLHDVSFVRLEPVELNRRDRTQIQTIDVHGVDERLAERRMAGDRA